MNGKLKEFLWRTAECTAFAAYCVEMYALPVLLAIGVPYLIYALHVLWAAPCTP